MNNEANAARSTREPLSAKQQIALEQLVLGKSVTEAAAVAKVDRSTLHRWLKEDWQFQAAYNRARRELQAALDTRMLQLARRALETVEEAVDKGDVHAALTVLKGLGLLPGSRFKFRSDDPEALESSAETREVQKVIQERIRHRTLSSLQ